MILSDWIAVAGVVANLMVALAAVFIPMWQRREMLNDARRVDRHAWLRCMGAFLALADALDTLVAAEKTAYPVKAYREVEVELRSASEALNETSANALPVIAVINAAKARQRVAALLCHFPDLKVYGPNLLTFASLRDDIGTARDEVHSLWSQTNRLGGRHVEKNENASLPVHHLAALLGFGHVSTQLVPARAADDCRKKDCHRRTWEVIGYIDQSARMFRLGHQYGGAVKPARL